MTTPAVATRSGGRTQQGRTPAPGQHMPGEFRPPRRAAKPDGQSTPVRSPQSGRANTATARQPARTQRRNTGQQAARTTRTAATPQTNDYQKIIAAEFVVAELLIAITPMTSRKNSSGISPYVPRDMTKMLAIGVLYFLLELLAIPAGWGGPMAWFGGLILLVVGLNEAANVVSDIDALAGFTPKKKMGASAGG